MDNIQYHHTVQYLLCIAQCIVLWALAPVLSTVLHVLCTIINYYVQYVLLCPYLEFCRLILKRLPNWSIESNHYRKCFPLFGCILAYTLYNLFTKLVSLHTGSGSIFLIWFKQLKPLLLLLLIILRRQDRLILYEEFVYCCLFCDITVVYFYRWD